MGFPHFLNSQMIQKVWWESSFPALSFSPFSSLLWKHPALARFAASLVRLIGLWWLSVFSFQGRVILSACWSWAMTDFRHTPFTKTSILSGTKFSHCKCVMPWDPRSSFNLESNYPWCLWGRLGALEGELFHSVLCAKSEFYCFFSSKTFYPFIL